MSLQLWMPLMGDLRNQGLGDYSISTLGTLSWVTGKLGSQAMRAGDGTQVVNGIRIEDTFTNLLNGNYSVSVWVKPYGQHVHYNGSIFSSGDWNKTNKRWAFGVSQDNSKVDVLCMNYNTYITCSVPENEWTHLVCARGNDDIVKLYKNGQYIGERNCSSDAAFDSDATFSCIGRESYANGYFSFNGAIQDFRLYNHCLSPMEIKQLSQGLILHYPLNRGGFGQENLIANTDFDGVSKKYTVTSSTEGGFRYTPTETIVANTEYTISCRLRGDANMNLYKICTGGNEAIYFVNRDQLSTSEYRRFSITFTYPSNKTLDQIYICTRYGTTNSQAGDWFEIEPCSLKLEKGSVATPWCPNSSDALATTMGLNSTIEYDCSGYCNNGTRTGMFAWTSNTPKYSVSTTFDGTNYISTTTPGADILTLSCWVKTSKNKSTSQIMVADSTSQLCISFYSGTIITFYASSGYSTGSKCTLGSAYKENDWNHLVVVKTGTGTRKVYCNGVEQTATSNDYWASSSVGFTVARRETSTPHAFYGELCDVRAYATALSADDVKSLYQNCATIDPDGTIRGQIRS